MVGSVSVVDKRKRLISTGGEFEEESGSPRDGKQKPKMEKINQLEDLAENKKLLIMMKLLMTSQWRTRNQQIRPTFFGQYIKHKWTGVDDERNGKDELYTGRAIGILDDDEHSFECEFQVAYDVDNDNNFTVVPLMEDWKEGWVEIINKKPKGHTITF